MKVILNLILLLESTRFRLLAIDHGLLSFVDLKHGQWPAILITNPKHALYHINGREPRQLIATSTHIRLECQCQKKL